MPSPPSAEQVSAWAGFPDGFKLQMQSETNDESSPRGKLVWGYTYKNPERSLTGFGIALCQPGTLWGTNRTRLPEMIEEHLKDPNKPQNDFVKTVVLPNGRKAWFTVIGFGPGGTGVAGFTYGPDYDLLVTEDFDAQDDVPRDKMMKNPVRATNDLPAVFLKVAAFLDVQQPK